MVKIAKFLLFPVVFIVFNFFHAQAEGFMWPGERKIAVSLSYDDGLSSQLDNVVPVLDKYNLKASFYILPNSAVVNRRMKEWVSVAKNGHELGNHSMYHPCRASLPNRKWVADHHDLDKYTVDQIVEELATANTFLLALDGKRERTFTPPCFDFMAGGKEYFHKVKRSFVAIKGEGVKSGFSVILVPKSVSAKELITYVKNVAKGTSLINIIFHGVGGNYLSVSSEAHAEFVKFLSENQDVYYVDSYINIMKYKKRLSHY